ncbi:alanyl-tRNA editing protein [Nakamurella panacisegetis]|uniref:metal-dependent hydrolase n=1 Tax=Nakamurella panacisegetis TaxID=1090615 RepID=UPI0018D3B21C|nr:metal-dependent hydrolase [Nakamurella panacisegetis]
MLPLEDTRVTFPAGGLTADGEVLAVVPLDDLGPGGLLGFVTDVSPFHPVDHGWPDQGPDRGVVSISGVTVEVVDVVLGATDGHNLLIATNIPVRRGEPGWAFVVVHVIGADQVRPEVGERVQLAVDAAHRDALGRGHTACHIAALALNAALADRWRKPVPVDGLGHPNFDQLALANSRIRPDGATDVYRLGKSLRKKGFDSADLPLAELTAAVNARLAGWVAAGATISIEADGPGLTDRRTWVCTLPDGQERILCGGTHPTSLAGIESIGVELTLDDAELVMQTSVARRVPAPPADVSSAASRPA